MLSFAGIDVSKDRLDVMVLPEEQRSSVSNDPTSWAELVEQLRALSIAAIGIEASGGYERGIMRALLSAGMPVRHVNPFKLRQFAKASGVLAKNDPLYARMIASFVAIMPTRPAQSRPPAVERLVEVLAVRRQLSAEKVAAENASRLLENAMLQRLSRRRIARLAADIEMLDERLVEIVAADAALAHRYRMLTSMPGVGPVLACTLIALLPELGRMSRKQVAALVGVAPYAFESGKLKGKRCVWGGRAPVRTVWSMGTLVATRCHPQINALYHRLLAAGKSKKVALTACRHKLVTMFNAMLQYRIPWQPQETHNEKNRQGPLDNQDSCSARASLPLPAAGERQRYVS